MNRMDWQQAFGPAPDEFRERVNSTLNRLEDKEMRRSMKFSTALIAAVLITVLLAGAAFAAVKLNIWQAFNYSEPIIPLEGADALVETDVYAAENEYFRFTVEEAVYDGYGSVLKMKATPVDPEKYVILDTLTGAGNVPDPENYVVEKVGVEGGGVWHEIVGRNDGKEIIWLNVPHATAQGTDPDDFYNSYDENINPDGSIDMWLKAEFWKPMSDELPVSISVKGFNKDNKPVYGVIDDISFTLTKRNEERTVKLVPAEDVNIEGFELIDAQITFTEIRGYIAVEFAGSAEECSQISFALYDSDGDPIVCGGSRSWNDNNERYGHEMEMQSYAEIPETMILEVRMFDGSSLGQIECRLEEVKP